MSWKFASQGNTIAVDFTVAADGKLSGTLSCNGVDYPVTGASDSTSMLGTLYTAFSVSGYTSPDPNHPNAFNWISASGVNVSPEAPPGHIAISVSVASSLDGTLVPYVALLYPPSDIRYVFVLMLENRSFDHLLGGLNISGTDAQTQQPTTVNGVVPGDSRFSNVFAGRTYTVRAGVTDPMDADPRHEFPDVMEQLCSSITDGNKQNPFPKGPYPPIDNLGFARSYAKALNITTPDDRIGEIMACCTKEQVPVLHTLATEFAVCDNWFSSLPGPTMPNRLFAMGGSSCGMDRSNDWVDVSNWTGVGFRYIKGSFFDHLRAQKLNPGFYFDSHWDPPGHAKGGSFPMAVFVSGVHAWNFAYMQDYASSFNPIASKAAPFVKAVMEMNPQTNQPAYPHQFTWIEPNYGTLAFDPGSGSSQHPRDTLAAGEQMVALVYNALRKSPLWNNSVLIITYDEHGGFYDHVAPPPAVPPGDGIRFNDAPYHPGFHFDFKRLGVRVPAIIVSPLVAKNTIDHTVYDHTSILRTVEDLFGMGSLTDRDKHANSLRGLLNNPLKTDCLKSVTANTSVVTPRETSVPRAADPLPESGTLVSTVLIALKTDLEVAGSDTRKRGQAIQEVDRLKTVGDAAAYVDSVTAMGPPPDVGSDVAEPAG